MEEWENVIRILADDTRRGIVLQMLTHDRCVRALARRAGVTEAAVSQHLRILREAGLVSGEKRGYYTHYRINRDLLRKAAGDLLEWATQTQKPDKNCHRQRGKHICQK